MRSIFPFFWRPTGVVSSLAELPVSDKVLAKRDVSISVSGEKSDEHPLLVAELAGGKIIGDLRLAATCDDVVVGGIQTCDWLQKSLRSQKTLCATPAALSDSKIPAWDGIDAGRGQRR